LSIEQSLACEFDRLSDGCERDAPAPSLAANELPGVPICNVVEHLPNHDAGALEGRFAVADEGIGHNVLAEFDALGFAVGFTLHTVVGICFEIQRIASVPQ